jgi:hypothetical protein
MAHAYPPMEQSDWFWNLDLWLRRPAPSLPCRHAVAKVPGTRRKGNATRTAGRDGVRRRRPSISSAPPPLLLEQDQDNGERTRQSRRRHAQQHRSKPTPALPKWPPLAKATYGTGVQSSRQTKVELQWFGCSVPRSKDLSPIPDNRHHRFDERVVKLYRDCYRATE